MFCVKKIIGIGLGILASIGVIFGIHKRRTRKSKQMDEVERDIQELNQEISELNEEELEKLIKEMTVFMSYIDKTMGLEDVMINENDLEINRLNDKMFYYGYVHGGPYGSVDYMSTEEKNKAFRRIMDILMNNAKTAKIGP